MIESANQKRGGAHDAPRWRPIRRRAQGYRLPRRAALYVFLPHPPGRHRRLEPARAWQPESRVAPLDRSGPGCRGSRRRGPRPTKPLPRRRSLLRHAAAISRLLLAATCRQGAAPHPTGPGAASLPSFGATNRRQRVKGAQRRSGPLTRGPLPPTLPGVVPEQCSGTTA